MLVMNGSRVDLSANLDLISKTRAIRESGKQRGRLAFVGAVARARADGYRLPDGARPHAIELKSAGATAMIEDSHDNR
jgi:hypothetical protein